MKNLVQKLYIIMLMPLILGFSVLIWNLTFGHVLHEYQDRKEREQLAEDISNKIEKQEETSFEQIILKGEESVKHYLGYKILETTRFKGHFHHVSTEISPDRHSYCGSCHGDMPHSQIKEIRAFLNMHSFFIGCQACHVKLKDEEKTGIYKWYSRETGEIVPSPVVGGASGAYTAKIVPFIKINGKISRIDTEEKINFVNEYRERENSLTQNQKLQAKSVIHQIIAKQPHICSDCHQKENPLLPLADLGYPKERIDSIISTEAVGMIDKYTEFYMPRMLHPGQEKAPKNSNNGDNEKEKIEKPNTPTAIPTNVNG